MAKLLATEGSQDSAQILIFSDAEVFQRVCEIAEAGHSPIIVTAMDEVDLTADPLTSLDVATPGVMQLLLGQVDEKPALPCSTVTLWAWTREHPTSLRGSVLPLSTKRPFTSGPGARGRNTVRHDPNRPQRSRQ